MSYFAKVTGLADAVRHEMAANEERAKQEAQMPQADVIAWCWGNLDGQAVRVLDEKGKVIFQARRGESEEKWIDKTMLEETKQQSLL